MPISRRRISFRLHPTKYPRQGNPTHLKMSLNCPPIELNSTHDSSTTQDLQYTLERLPNPRQHSETPWRLHFASVITQHLYRKAAALCLRLTAAGHVTLGLTNQTFFYEISRQFFLQVFFLLPKSCSNIDRLPSAIAREELAPVAPVARHREILALVGRLIA